MTVHKDADTTSGSGYVVYVVEEETAKPRTVSIGEAVGDRFEVISGLEEGETVVIRGNERLQPGQKVQVLS